MRGASNGQPRPGTVDGVACYQKLLGLLHPQGLACPRCGARDGFEVHRRHRDPVLDYMCAHCHRVFNAWTGTVLQGTHRPPEHLFLILWGIVSGTTTAQTARSLGCRRAGLVPLRRRLGELARRALEQGLFPDAHASSDIASAAVTGRDGSD